MVNTRCSLPSASAVQIALLLFAALGSAHDLVKSSRAIWRNLRIAGGDDAIDDLVRGESLGHGVPRK